MNEFSLNNYRYRILQLDNPEAAAISGYYIYLENYNSKKHGYVYNNSVRDYSESGNFVYIADVNSTRFLDDVLSSGFHVIKNEIVNRVVYYPDLTYKTQHKFSLKNIDSLVIYNLANSVIYPRSYEDVAYRSYYELLEYDDVEGEYIDIITNIPNELSDSENPKFYINSPIYLFESNLHELGEMEYVGYSKGLSLFDSVSGILIKNINNLKHVNKIHQNDESIYFGGLSTDYDIFADNYDVYAKCQYLITKQYDLLSTASGKIQYQNLYNNYQSNFGISIKRDSLTKIAGHFTSGYFDIFFLAKDIESKNILEYIPQGYLKENKSTYSEFYNAGAANSSFEVDDDSYLSGFTAMFNHKGHFWSENFYHKNIESVRYQNSGIIRINCEDSNEDIKQKFNNAIGYEPEVFGDLENDEIFVISRGIMDYSNYSKMMNMKDFNFTRRELQLFSYPHYNHVKGEIKTYGCINPSGDILWMNRHGSDTLYNYHNQSGDYYTVTPNRLGEIYSIAESENSGVVVFGGNLVKEYSSRTFHSGSLKELSLTSDLGYYSEFRYPTSTYNVPNKEATGVKKQNRYKINNIYDMQNSITDVKCLKHDSYVSQSLLFHSGDLSIVYPAFTNPLEGDGY